MSLEFVHNYQGNRYQPPPQSLPAMPPDDSDESGTAEPELDLEYPRDSWKSLPIATKDGDLTDLPQRFIDGRHRGETVLWLSAPTGEPIPVRLAEIAAGCITLQGRRENQVVQRVVSLISQPFPWEEIEGFVTALQVHGYRFLDAPAPLDESGARRVSFDFGTMENQPRTRVQREMQVLEEMILCQNLDVPTLMDGRIGWFSQPGLETRNIVGVIKNTRERYLHNEGIQVLMRLSPAERTPFFAVQSHDMPVITWFLRLAGSNRSMPNSGIVRIEVPKKRFETQQLGSDFVNRLSKRIYDLRSRHSDYQRSAISLEPIVRVEASLSACMTPPQHYQNRFYRLLNI
ncbi:hypothetical protein [Tuwongella immobilis]|uniref:Single-stranded exonuclease associated with rad50 mre11 complex: Uncharacterized protein n=1 Tax=Tuwongella immobilis TaxID=692036 RepID=A0A6C2YK09_9BACT|nr:hypothetical protein [Tuwongella immobilis]VIP01631.1 single-stranded exonuclease associated with rad50 mre11 complex : Uncharacterized protein OS=Nitrolancea hollandica Lb GN=NITHO_1310005 PE=4 SV=1 [Tuwongella immobilis]VTR98981.1 single-stranded exonuclease associated with rad50 mre11 complex : Uncharacterized protein OS=Nitrolancea hollandica Lb GN=NITHO_1310005 PE=4 SV=1 [Tuwongella immobilis]